MKALNFVLLLSTFILSDVALAMDVPECQQNSPMTIDQQKMLNNNDFSSIEKLRGRRVARRTSRRVSRRRFVGGALVGGYYGSRYGSGYGSGGCSCPYY